MFLLNTSKNNLLFCIENYNIKRWFNKSIKQYWRIFNKLKTYKNKKIFLEKENLNEFLISLCKENWTQEVFNLTAIVK